MLMHFPSTILYSQWQVLLLSFILNIKFVLKITFAKKLNTLNNMNENDSMLHKYVCSVRYIFYKHWYTVSTNIY